MKELTFESNYFKDSHISNYRDYAAKKYDGLCTDLLSLGIEQHHRIVDFGCATGALLKEFLKRGFHNIRGTDVSYWAIQYGRRTLGLNAEQLQFLNYGLLESDADWLLFLDVLEHIGDEELDKILSIIRCKRMIMRVPVSAVEGGHYVLEVSRNDRTHVQCHTKQWWIDKLSRYADLQSIISKRHIYDSEGVLAAIFRWKRYA